jgi:hypothetical protein
MDFIRASKIPSELLFQNYSCYSDTSGVTIMLETHILMSSLISRLVLFHTFRLFLTLMLHLALLLMLCLISPIDLTDSRMSPDLLRGTG